MSPHDARPALRVEPGTGPAHARRARLTLIAAALSLVCMLAMLTPALAHAVLVRSDPADGAVLAAPPSQVKLWFSEAIAGDLSQFRVLDAGGKPVEGAQKQFNPDEPDLVVVALPSLAGGPYTVAFDAVSADDGHAEPGQIAFSIRGAAPDVGSVETRPALPPVAEVALRWLNLLAMIGTAGALAVAALVLGGTPNAGRVGRGLDVLLPVARRRALILAAWFALAGALFGGLLLMWQAAGLATAAGGSPPAGLMQLLPRLVRGNRAGQLWLVREMLLLTIGVLLFVVTGRYHMDAGRRTDWQVPASGFLALLVLGTQALSSHAAALPAGAGVAVVADWLHLAAAGVWTGGLLALAISVLPSAWRQRGTPAFSTTLRAGWQPFGRLAAFSVGMLAATGLYSLGRQVASLDALVTTVYGQALLAKVALVLGVGALGLLNSSLLHARVAAPIARLLRRPEGWTPLSLRRLPYLVMAEGSLAILVLLATGLITSSAPAIARFQTTAAVTGARVLISDRPLEPVLTVAAAAIFAAMLLAMALSQLQRSRAPRHEVVPEPRTR